MQKDTYLYILLNEKTKSEIHENRECKGLYWDGREAWQRSLGGMGVMEILQNVETYEGKMRKWKRQGIVNGYTNAIEVYQHVAT